ncbi:hypothetical protein IE992_14230 [Klebsiella pneumoniae]|uniref:Thiamin ABC transporter n=1 Tax=Klebsiella pneumoniae TaxID=573 RepID=A0A927DYB0_KLEPN|nr:hypothetical protein [Klebsiella pneumoniae]
MKKLLPLLALVAMPALAKPVLTVYTYDSFSADWGPGPAVKKAFEAECGCELKFVALEDGVSLLNRLRMEGKTARPTLCLALITTCWKAAAQSKLFAKATYPPARSACRAAGIMTPLFPTTTAISPSSMTKTNWLIHRRA